MSMGLRVALVQAAPVFLDRAATLEKACALVRQAGEQGAQLVVFGESFLPGHPIWTHLLAPTDPRAIELAVRLTGNALTVPGPESRALAAAARSARAMVVLGFVERPDPAASVIYSSALVIGPDGTVLGVRRKLVPAVGERVLFTAGSGPDIRVFDSPWGPLSVLLGGENSNPLLTYALRGLGARIHVAGWPPHFNKRGIMQETMRITGAAVAYQNTAHVLAVGGISDESALIAIARTDDDRSFLSEIAAEPASMVFAPRGRIQAGPGPDGEGLLLADLDLDAGTWAQLVNRHYDRPDLLRLIVDTRPAPQGVEIQRADDSAVDSLAEARAAVEQRFGAVLPASDIEELLPYVAQTLQDSAALESAAPDSGDAPVAERPGEARG